jgi:hypothetical protein
MQRQPGEFMKQVPHRFGEPWLEKVLTPLEGESSAWVANRACAGTVPGAFVRRREH